MNSVAEPTDLARECAEALSTLGFYPDALPQYLSLVEAALADCDLDDDFADLLRAAVPFLRMNEEEALTATFLNGTTYSQSKIASERIMSYLDAMGMRRFIYHGTSARHLPSIQREGLVPGHRRSSWGYRSDLREHSATAVFFSERWRIASQWSLGSGTRKSAAAIIRLRADGLTLEKDAMSAYSGSLMSSLKVDVSQAEVLVEPFARFPIWEPLNQVVDRIRAAKRSSRSRMTD
jgi:hypothetical protein